MILALTVNVGHKSEIAKTQVGKLRVFINCHPDTPPKPPIPLARADLSIVLCTPRHSHTRRGGCLGILKGFWGAGRGGWRFMKTRVSGF